MLGRNDLNGQNVTFSHEESLGQLLSLFLVKLFGYQVLKVPLVPNNTTTYENTWAYHLVHITSIIRYSRGCCYHFRCGHYSLIPHLCEMQFKEGHQVWSSLQDKAEWHLVFQVHYFWNGTHWKAAGWIYWNVCVCVCGQHHCRWTSMFLSVFLSIHWGILLAGVWL